MVVAPWAIAADPVVGYRGNGTGAYPNATPPLHWSKNKNVVWSTPLPPSNSLPVLVRERIFVTGEPTKLICLRASNGEKLWEHDHSYQQLHSPASWAKIEAEFEKAANFRASEQEIGREIRKLRRLQKDQKTPAREAQMKTLEKRLADLKKKRETELPLASQWEMPRTHGRLNGYSTPTPTTDGKHVWAAFGHGVVACYELDGNRKWIKLVEKPTNSFGHSASPLLVDGTLIVHVNDMIALDAQAGQERWRKKVNRSWGSPVAAKLGQTAVILTPQCDVVRVSDGKHLGGARRVNLRYPTPLIQDGVAYFVDSFSNSVKMPNKVKDKLPLEATWRQRLSATRYYSSPIVHNKLIYTISSERELTVLEADSGKIVYSKELDLDGTIFSSITLAGDHLFVNNSEGTTLILDAGRQYKEIARNRLGKLRSTPVFDGKRMYLRTLEHLYCISE